jgi:pyrroline-5-carboxylate reductase
MPSSYIETMPDGLVPMFPAQDEVRRVLAHAGTVMAFDQEEQFDLATVAACMSGWLYRAAGALAEWFEEKGLSPEDARLLATGNIMGAMAHARATPQASLEEISDRIATDGTYTKLGLDGLRAAQFMEPWQKAMDAVFARMNGKA